MKTDKPRLLIDVGKLKKSNNGLDTFLRSYISELEALSQAKEFNINLLAPRSGIPHFSTKFKCIKLNRFKNIHIHQLTSKFDLWHSPFHSINRVPKNDHCKHIATIHDFNPIYEKPQRRKKILKDSFNHLLNTEHIVCISKFTQKELNTHHPSLTHINNTVIYNGVNEELPGKTPSQNIPKRFLFSLGAFMKKKNYATIIAMMPYIDDDIHLIIAGSCSGSYIEQLKKQITHLNLNHRIHLLTNITNDTKNWLLNQCEAFLFPSLLEGFGLPPVEAMKHGKTVFIFNNTSIPEIVGNAGVMWYDQSPQKMAQVVNQELKNYKHISAEQIAKNKIHADQFCWHKMALSYLDLFTQILSHKE